MFEKGLLAVFSVVFVVIFLQTTDALPVNVTYINSTMIQVRIEDSVTNLYGYEVNFNYTNSLGTPTHTPFLGSGASVTTGRSLRGDRASVYSSRLLSSRAGATGIGALFNVSFTGNINLEYVVFALNDSTQNITYFNTTGYLTGCRKLSQTNSVFTLQNDVATSIDCFNVTATNLTIDGGGKLVTFGDSSSSNSIEGVTLNSRDSVVKNIVLIKGSSASSTVSRPGIFFNGADRARAENVTVNSSYYGLYFLGTENATAENVTLYDSTFRGIFIDSSRNALLRNVEVRNSIGDAIFLDDSASANSNTTLQNLTILNTNASKFDLNVSEGVDNLTLIDMPHVGNYSFTGVGGKIIVRESSVGEIKFLQNVNGSGTNFSADVVLSNNFAEVRSGVNVGLNRSANVTLYSVPTTFESPVILKDGEVCTTCYNFTSLNAGTVIFNVSSWSNYTIGENPENGGGGGDPGVSGGSSSGGGGGGSSIQEPLDVTILPSELEFSAIIDRPLEKELSIVNGEGRDVRITLSIEGLEGVLTLNRDSFVLGAGVEDTIFVRVLPRESKIYTGKIIVQSDEQIIKEILITINVRSENFLFDSKISLSNAFKTIAVGQNLVAQVDLLQVGPRERIDVVATYVIKDFEGNTHLEDSETFAVLNERSYIKTFDTSRLPPGRYVLGLEIIYPGAFATSSASFQVSDEETIPFENVVIAGIILLFVLCIFVVVIIIRKIRK